MSRARICDGCNKVLKCDPSAEIKVDFGYNGTAEYELCEDCKVKLLQWMENLKGNRR